MNNRYYYKRACYLAVLANAIQSSKKGGFKVQFGCLDGDTQKPILVVGPSGGKNEQEKGVPESEILTVIFLPR
jgi:U3 small nucleolar RNA-associated protein 22